METKTPKILKQHHSGFKDICFSDLLTAARLCILPKSSLILRESDLKKEHFFPPCHNDSVLTASFWHSFAFQDVFLLPILSHLFIFGFIFLNTEAALSVSQAYKCYTSKISFTY